MGKEIERKFVVTGDDWREKASGIHYRQGYLSVGGECTVRVRRAGDQGFLTIKGRPVGIVRDEYEYEIPTADADELLDRLCTGGIVEKFRHNLRYAGRIWEVDEFLGANSGLVVAEIELAKDNEAVDLPPWVGVEVTDDPRYSNASLAHHPFSAWGRP
jgi:CYTH domain-containing protein